MKVSAVVISHGHRAELAESLPALVPQVDDVVVIANTPGSEPADALGARVIENARPASFAANINAGTRATTGELVLVSNPDAVPEPGAIAVLREFMEAHPRCGVAGPQLVDPDGSWQPSQRRFPTVGGTLVRRTPLRRVRPPLEHQRDHYLLDERPTEPVRGGLDARRLPAPPSRDARPSSAVSTRASACTARRSTSATGRRRRAGRGWYVPGAVVRHRWDAATDKSFFTKRTLWHWRGILRFVRKHPERLKAW